MIDDPDLTNNEESTSGGLFFHHDQTVQPFINGWLHTSTLATTQVKQFHFGGFRGIQTNTTRQI